MSEENLCLHLGYKAASADKPQPRVIFAARPDAEIKSHSEEHLVVRSRFAKNRFLGDFFLGIPGTFARPQRLTTTHLPAPTPTK